MGSCRHAGGQWQLLVPEQAERHRGVAKDLTAVGGRAGPQESWALRRWPALCSCPGGHAVAPGSANRYSDGAASVPIAASGGMPSGDHPRFS